MSTDKWAKLSQAELIKIRVPCVDVVWLYMYVLIRLLNDTYVFCGDVLIPTTGSVICAFVWVCFGSSLVFFQSISHASWKRLSCPHPVESPPTRNLMRYCTSVRLMEPSCGPAWLLPVASTLSTLRGGVAVWGWSLDSNKTPIRSKMSHHMLLIDATSNVSYIFSLSTSRPQRHLQNGLLSCPSNPQWVGTWVT